MKRMLNCKFIKAKLWGMLVLAVHSSEIFHVKSLRGIPFSSPLLISPISFILLYLR